MAKITVTAAGPQRKVLRGADDSGDTFVLIKPPGMRESQLRAGLLSKRFTFWNQQGNMVQGVDCNAVDLAKHEIWWTYGGTNLDVDIQGENGEIQNIRFKDDMDYSDFMREIDKLGIPELVHIFNEWHVQVLECVEAWRNPF